MARLSGEISATPKGRHRAAIGIVPTWLDRRLNNRWKSIRLEKYRYICTRFPLAMGLTVKFGAVTPPFLHSQLIQSLLPVVLSRFTPVDFSRFFGSLKADGAQGVVFGAGLPVLFGPDRLLTFFTN